MKKLIQTALIIAMVILQSCTKELKNYENTQAMIDAAKSEIKFISADDFKKVMDSDKSFYLIDCRETEEFDSSCIKGAIHIPRGKIEEEISAQAPHHLTSVYVYCNNGDRSILVAQILPEFKYSSVYVIEGGLENWVLKFPDEVELHPVRGNATKKAVKPAGGCGG